MTSKYESAVHYSASNKSATDHYVYTLEVPDKTDKNHIAFKQQINPSIVAKAEKKLGHTIPTKFTEDGKEFRKWFANFRMDYLDFCNLIGDERYSDRLTYDGRWENNLYQF